MLKTLCILAVVLLILHDQTVNAIGFDTGVVSCETARRQYSYISCTNDGSYNMTQCRNKYCVCVNATTGEVFSGSETFRIGSKEANYCRQLEQCGAWKCRLYCPSGYNTSDNGCRQCSCRKVTCDYSGIKEATKDCGIGCLRYNRVCFSCISNCNQTGTPTPTRCGSDEEYVKRGWGLGTCRSKLEINDTCTSDDDDGNDDGGDGDGDGDDGGDIVNEIPAAQLEIASSREEDQMDEEEEDRIQKIFTGSSSRKASRKIHRYVNQCRDGNYCQRTGDRKGRCKKRNTDGPCFTQKNENSDECDDNGYFKPRYCKSRGRRIISCVCVFPNGTELVDTVTQFRKTGDDETDEQRKPRCSARVYGSCRVTRGRRKFTVKHRRRVTDPCACRVCTCLYGRLYCRTQRNCRRCDNSKNCTLPNNSTIGHGESARVDCNKCLCRYGELYCTDRDCDTTGSNDNCGRCKSERVNKVCDPNGRTYINSCTAIHCAGVAPVDLIDGPCPRTNPCIRFPCTSGHVCVKRGGVSCLAHNTGCKPETLRLCINVSDLVCTNETMIPNDDDDTDSDTDGDGIGNGDIDPDDTSVCGDNGNSYRSTCHLLQNTVNVTIVHAGKCNALRCKGGPVCGTDGVTYENICELQTQSNNARLDYKGRCVDDDDSTAGQVCRRVIMSGQCHFDTSNCPCLVRPVVGCCPVCGGAVLALLDREGISNASMLDTELETLDGYMRKLASSEELFINTLSGRCSVEPSLTAGGNIEMIISSFTNKSDDRCYCHGVASNVTAAINRSVEAAQTGGRNRRQTTSDGDTTLPESYQYLLGANEAELEASSSTGTTTSPSPTSPSPTSPSSTSPSPTSPSPTSPSPTSPSPTSPSPTSPSPTSPSPTSSSPATATAAAVFINFILLIVLATVI